MAFGAFKDDCLLPAYNGKNNACLTPRCMTVHYMVNRSNKLIFNTDLLLMCSYKLKHAKCFEKNIKVLSVYMSLARAFILHWIDSLLCRLFQY